MPKSDELATEFKSLQELAMKIDEHPDQAEELVAATKAPESRPEPVADDKVEETAPRRRLPRWNPPRRRKSNQKNIEPREGDSDYVRKEKERFAKNWQIYQKRDQESKTQSPGSRGTRPQGGGGSKQASLLPAKNPFTRTSAGTRSEDYETYADAEEQEGDWQVAKNAREEAIIARQEGVSCRVARQSGSRSWKPTRTSQNYEQSTGQGGGEA